MAQKRYDMTEENGKLKMWGVETEALGRQQK
jgi:hypothetical protein